MHKAKKLLVILAVTTGVYLAFKYLLLLVLPFLAAYWISLMLKPAAKRINRLTGLPISFSLTVVLMLCLAVLGAVLIYLGRLILNQAASFVETVPFVWDKACGCVSDICCCVDEVCGIGKGTVYGWLCDKGQVLLAKAENGSMEYVVGSGIPIVSGIFGAAAMLIIIIIAVIMFPSVWDDIRRWKNTSIFRVEIGRISERLKNVAVSFAGSQLVILVLTSIICSFGLWILKSRYALLFGIAIGFMDLLPILGTGTVFIPWIVYTCVSGDYCRAAILMTIYIVCYFLREYLEARLMGKGIGLSSIETLISIYVGFKVFGLAGVITGPIGYIIIKELTDMYSAEKMQESSLK